jgi:tRNA-dihydrouridine synthase
VKTMTSNVQPHMVKYAGHLYVLAEDDEAPELELEQEEAQEDEEEELGEEGEEEEEEIELLDALKKHWQVILDKLPDDLEVDEEFEEALNGIDEVIDVMEKIHEEYEEGLEKVEELPEEEAE